MINLHKNILIIDLDGTFVSVNTFHKWMIFLFKEEVKKFHFTSVINILKIIALRLIKSISHAEMKFRILQTSQKVIEEQQIHTFINTLDPFINKHIIDKLQEKTGISILATAAPLFYAKKIKEKYHFDHVIATPPTTETPWKENIREEKRKNLMLLLKSHSLNNNVSILYTDHHDDLPLMQFSDYTYLVNASEKTMNIVNQKKIRFYTR